MRFVPFSDVRARLQAKRIAVVGSGPGCVENERGFVDGHEVVIRVNNYKTGGGQGKRCDVHYSFFGTSIRKTAGELAADGVQLCMCKLPNSQPIDSAWHRERGKLVGIDYRYIYTTRAPFWFCDTFVPDDAHFLAKFELLGKHQPTTGFAAILDVLACDPREVFLTGFDGFSSGIHNVNEAWKPGDPTDPICHRPDLELHWLKTNKHRFTADRTLSRLL
jgi:hypothetical protein